MDDSFQRHRVALAEAGDANMSKGLLLELACSIKHSSNLPEPLKVYFVEALLKIIIDEDPNIALNLKGQKVFERFSENFTKNATVFFRVEKVKRTKKCSTNMAIDDVTKEVNLETAQVRKRYNAFTHGCKLEIPLPPENMSEAEYGLCIDYVIQTSRISLLLKHENLVDYQALPSFSGLIESLYVNKDISPET
jgi:hypothetical protein